jgi:serine/threonine protein kinase
VLAIYARDAGVVLGLCTRHRDIAGRAVTSEPLAFVLRPRGGPDDDDVVTSLKEARRLVQLRHRHLQRVVEAGETELRLDDVSPRVTRVAYALYEPVEGDTLREWVEHGRPAPRELLEHALHVGGALRVLHEQKVVHRHVSPDDIVIDHAGSAVLCLHPLHRMPTAAIGLGHVRVSSDAQGDAHRASPPTTLPRDVSPLRRGWTPARYLAPEARLGQWSAGVDEWGLGVTCWELLTQQHPYESNDDAALQVLAGQTRDPETLAQLRRILDVLRKAVDLDPARRWGSAARLCAALVASRVEGELHDLQRSTSAPSRRSAPPAFVSPASAGLPSSPSSPSPSSPSPSSPSASPTKGSRRGDRAAIATALVLAWLAVFAVIVGYLARGGS